LRDDNYVDDVACARFRNLHPRRTSPASTPAPGQEREAFASLRETLPESGRVLTDDFNPVEFYDAPNRERTRRSLAAAMKNL